MILDFTVNNNLLKGILPVEAKQIGLMNSQSRS